MSRSPSRSCSVAQSKAAMAKEEEQWVDLQSHPIFNKAQLRPLTVDDPSSSSFVHVVSRLPLNLMAWDGFSRLCVWNSAQQCLHSIDIRCSHPHADTIQASTRVKTLGPNMKVNFPVRYLAIGRTGQSVVLASDGSIMVLYLNDRIASPADDGICRSIAVGSRRIYSSKDSKNLRILQVTWHPHSDTHLGILSSDCVLRLFDLSSNLEIPEQEYHLQPATLHNLMSAVAIRPVAFAFGGEHLWDRFTVFVLFSNCSVYALCPVVPFGSIYNSSTIEEIYKDAYVMGLQSNSVGSKAASNASLAVAWLEAIFPELVNSANVLAAERSASLGLKARAYAPFDASVSLQGPLSIMIGGNASSGSNEPKEQHGRAVSFLYNTVIKDSIFAIGLSDGQMRIFALADELQPVWDFGSSPRLRVDDDDNLLSVAMVVKAKGNILDDSTLSVERSDSRNKVMDNAWSGHSPPLLQLSVVDFSLPKTVLEVAPLSLLADPIIPERLYCYHGGGIDAILLHWLPFSDLIADRSSAGKAPSVFPVLDTCPTEDSIPTPLLGVTVLLDSFGKSWLIALTSACECAVIEMKTQRELQPLQIDCSKEIDQSLEVSEMGNMEIMSKELVLGPKDIPIPQVSSSGRSLTADSIEGRSILHDHYKLLHEKYVEYAHKVYVELKYHGLRLNKVVDDQQLRLQEVKEKLHNVQKNESYLRERTMRSVEVNRQLEERLKKFSNLPGVKESPLTAAERDFKSQIDMVNSEDLNYLHSAIDVLNARSERYMLVSQAHLKKSPIQTVGGRKLAMPDTQMSRLKTAVGKLSQIVDDSTRKVKLVEDVVKRRESMGD